MADDTFLHQFSDSYQTSDITGAAFGAVHVSGHIITVADESRHSIDLFVLSRLATPFALLMNTCGVLRHILR